MKKKNNIFYLILIHVFIGMLIFFTILAKVYGYAIFLLEYMLLSNYKTEMMNVYL
jgi:hypothetical protein